MRYCIFLYICEFFIYFLHSAKLSVIDVTYGTKCLLPEHQEEGCNVDCENDTDCGTNQMCCHDGCDLVCQDIGNAVT